MKVNIKTIIDGLESVSDDVTVYYDTVTGDTVLWFEYGDNEDIDLEDLDTDRCIMFPDRYEINEYHMMENFAYDNSPELIRAIQGRGAFQRFRNKARELGLSESWYEFRDTCYRSKAEDWCRNKGLEWV